MSNRGLKKQYDRKVLETFDLIGCFFIDLFYNDLFLKAKHVFSTGNAKSLTDVYRSHIIWFMRGIKDKPKNYVDVMKKLLEYYNTATKTITSTLAELENKILSQFIPVEYYQDFNNSNKEKTLHDIIIRAINQLGEIVLEQHMLGKIIDDHLNQSNIQLLQERMTDVFISQREEYYSQFVNEISRSNGNTTVSRDQFKKLKAAYADEVKKRVAAEAERDKAIQLLQASLQKISNLEEQVRSNGEITTPQRVSLQPAHLQPAHRSPPRSASHGLTLGQPTLTPNLTPTKLAPQVSPLSTPTKRVTPNARIQSQQSVQSPNNVQSSQKSNVVVGSVGLKLSDLTIDDNILTDVTTDPADSPQDTQMNIMGDSSIVGDNMGDSNVEPEEGDNTEDSDESGSEDSEELHRKQKEKLANRNMEPSLDLNDDPGFGI